MNYTIMINDRPSTVIRLRSLRLRFGWGLNLDHNPHFRYSGHALLIIVFDVVRAAFEWPTLLSVSEQEPKRTTRLFI